GIFKTTNATQGAGATWTRLASTQTWSSVTRFAISPNGSILLATTVSVIQRSTNGGASWTTTYPTGGDVVFHPTDSNRVVAGIDRGAIYSNNGGASWSLGTIANVSKDRS